MKELPSCAPVKAGDGSTPRWEWMSIILRTVYNLLEVNLKRQETNVPRRYPSALRVNGLILPKLAQ